MDTIKRVAEVEGVEYVKWISSIHYEDSCGLLLRLMESQDEEDAPDYVLPLIVCLVAALEAKLNDWLIMDTFEKHGPGNYEMLVHGFISMGPKSKFRAAVPIMTDNHFQVREEASVVQDLDELIEARNKLVHPKPRFYSKVSKHAHRPKKQRPEDHPLSTLGLEDCRRYLQAVETYDSLFLRQYDDGLIKENELVRMIEKQIGP